jgi:hypothetical protein
MSARPPHELLLAAHPIDILGIALSPIEYGGVRVMTLAMIDQVHQRPEGTARRNFSEHRARLIDGEDFFELTADEIRTQSLGDVFPPRTGKAMLLTETGYSMLVKSFTDDLAWDVQRQLVKSYFAKPAQAADPLAGLPPEQRALIALMVDNASIKAEQAAQGHALAAQAEVQAEQGAALTAVGQRVGDLVDTMLMLARPAGAESIVHIRERINKLHGLPTRIIDEVLRQSPIAPKPAGMVKHSREEARGGSYAVYWIKDVSAVFARFANECTRVTATQVTHPYIDGRFKLLPTRDRP